MRAEGEGGIMTHSQVDSGRMGWTKGPAMGRHEGANAW